MWITGGWILNILKFIFIDIWLRFVVAGVTIDVTLVSPYTEAPMRMNTVCSAQYGLSTSFILPTSRKTTVGLLRDRAVHSV